MTEDTNARLDRIMASAAANRARADADQNTLKQEKLRLAQAQAKDAQAWEAFEDCVESRCVDLNNTIGEHGLRLNVERETKTLSVTVINANARSEATVKIDASDAGMAAVKYLKTDIGSNFNIDLHDSYSAHVENMLLQLLEYHVDGTAQKSS